MDRISHFFDQFCEDFKGFDGAVIASRFIRPLVVVHSEGKTNSYESTKAIENYFQGYLNDYRSKGAVSCVYKDLESIPINKGAYLATVSWELLSANGCIVVAWRESYCLVEVKGELKAFSTFDH